MKKEIKFNKGDIVRFLGTTNHKYSAKIGAIAKVIRGRIGKSPYMEIEWIDKNSLGQSNGKYFWESFENLTNP